MSFAVTKTQNALEDGSVPVDDRGRPKAWCEWCSNSGLCMLEGDLTIDGASYSRGTAPCKWCLQGELRYTEWTAATGIRKGTDRQGGKHIGHHRRLEPETEFTMYDVLATQPDPRGAERFVPTVEWCRQRERDGCNRGGLWVALGRHRAAAWPPEWPAPGRELIEGIPDDASEAEKRRIAVEAKNEAERMGQQ
jgi:hypothetical protein